MKKTPWWQRQATLDVVPAVIKTRDPVEAEALRLADNPAHGNRVVGTVAQLVGLVVALGFVLVCIFR